MPSEYLQHQPNALRAAQYVRMSTEHQQYSTNNQADKILEYAQRRNIEIVRTYADEGKSGLSLGGRASLQKLIADVETGVADFTLVLVYDVSRWGRFQDADEAAFYEYKLKRKGILVAYVAEQFENDGSPSPPSSKASSAPWPVNTAGNCRPRCLLANAA
jgi:DNA invertase Pin-like site-specific DNA recombinase